MHLGDVAIGHSVQKNVAIALAGRVSEEGVSEEGQQSTTAGLLNLAPAHSSNPLASFSDFLERVPCSEVGS